MSAVERLYQYIQTLLEAGINVPAEVQSAAEHLIQKQIADHGK